MKMQKLIFAAISVMAGTAVLLLSSLAVLTDGLARFSALAMVFVVVIITGAALYLVVKKDRHSADRMGSR